MGWLLTMGEPAIYGFFIVDHARRKILHVNVTEHPRAEWVVQQLREAFPEAGPYRYAIFDRDSTFNEEVVTFLEATGLKVKRTSVQAPWQNGTAERWIASARRDCFDHVIAFNEAHVRRLGREFVAYYHDDRTHLGLEKDTPSERAIEAKPDTGNCNRWPESTAYNID